MASTQAPPLADPPAGDLPLASAVGHGTLEVLEFIHAFEHAGIHCCLVGVSALKFYGAARIRDEWDICVPTERLQDAVSLLEHKPLSQKCKVEGIPANRTPTLYDTFPRFRHLKVRDLHFRILSSQAAHVPCTASSIRRSSTGIPYPLLHHFVQGRLDTRDGVDLADVIDGMNLSKDWAHGNLDLSCLHDSRWAEWSNKRLKDAVPNSTFGLISTKPIDRQAVWEKLTGNKQQRMGWKYSKDRYATRFRRHNSADPTTIERDMV